MIAGVTKLKSSEYGPELLWGTNCRTCCFRMWL